MSYNNSREWTKLSDNKLCNLSDIEDGNSAAFTAEFDGKTNMVLAVRNGERVTVYLNSCPHTGAPLDLNEGKFLSRERKYIICSTHGALFKIEDGYCISGPCRSSSLEAVPVTIKNGDVLIL